MPAPTKKNVGGASKARAPKVTHAFADAFRGLREILERYCATLETTADAEGNFMLYSRKAHQGKPLFFAGATARRSYVSFYLFPIYMFPQLVRGVSPALAARRQGKSCFNFTSRDDLLFAELAALTERGYKHFHARGLL